VAGIFHPNQVAVQVGAHDSPAAFPQSVSFATPAGPQFHIFGGLTKLEWMVGMIVSGSHMSSRVLYETDAEWDDNVGRVIVAKARLLLDLCRSNSAVEDDESSTPKGDRNEP
jgi:hypothetical protein